MQLCLQVCVAGLGQLINLIISFYKLTIKSMTYN